MSDIKPRTGQPDLAPDELDAIAADVQWDMRAGQGAKHFQDVLDELHSTQARPTHGPDKNEQERIERAERTIMSDLKQAATYELLSHGMRVRSINHNGHGTGWIAAISDAEGRLYEAQILYDEAAKIDAAINGHAFFRKLVDGMVSEALEARRKYFVRACIMVEP